MKNKNFNSIINKTIHQLEDNENGQDVLKIITQAIKTFIPCDVIHLLSIDKDKHIATIIENQKEKRYFSLEKRGVLSQCYHSHQPLILNNIKQSLLFDKNIDNLSEKVLKRVLLVPVLNNKSSYILGMVWIGISKGFQQFIQKDIDNLVLFTNAIKYYIFIQSNKSKEEQDNQLSSCQRAKMVLEEKVKRDELYFASTIHDIRTPMNAVIGFMELLLLNETDNQKKEYINATLKSSDQMVSLINDILDMSKISSGKMNLSKTEFSPIDGLSDVAKLFYNTMKKKSINFLIYIDPKLPSLIYSDLHRIKQILNNLLSNAMKFTPIEGEISFEAIYDKNGDRLTINIIDNGIGIAKNKQNSIFNPYTQEENSTAKNYGGTGLGLSISQQLSTLLNGTLSLKSIQGKGSTFTLIIPCETPPNTSLEINNKEFKDIKVLLFTKCTEDIEHDELNAAKRYLEDLNINYIESKKNNLSVIQQNIDILIIDRRDAIDNQDIIQNFLDTGGKIIFVCYLSYSVTCPFEGDFRIIHYPTLPKLFYKTIENLINPNKKSLICDSEIDTKTEIFNDKKILIVDDDVINLKLMSEIVKRFEINITVATNGKEALKLFAKNGDFDLMLIDQNMPIMNGDDFIRVIRKKEKSQNLKKAVIYSLTGDSSEVLEKQILSAGADKVFTKPVHIKTINKAIVDAFK